MLLPQSATLTEIRFDFRVPASSPFFACLFSQGTPFPWPSSLSPPLDFSFLNSKMEGVTSISWDDGAKEIMEMKWKYSRNCKSGLAN